MFQKISSSVMALMICSAVALAGPAPKAVKGSFDGYVKEVAAETGKSEKEVRDEAIEALRKEGKYKEADLERIGREKVDFDPAKQHEMVNLLKSSESFRARTGLAAVRNESIKKEAGDAFDGMKDDHSIAKGEQNGPKKTDRTKPSGDELTVLTLGNISKAFGSSRATDAIKTVTGENFGTMMKVGTTLARRVRKGTLDAATAEKMIINIAASPKVLEGKLVVGDGASEACMAMAKEAVENMGDFIDGGAAEGKDPVSYTKGMGKRAAEKFKQDLEEGIARVCALASSGCKLFSSAIVKACAQINGAKAI